MSVLLLFLHAAFAVAGPASASRAVSTCPPLASVSLVSHITRKPPVLAFTGDLATMPLRSLRDKNYTVFAFPGPDLHSDGSTFDRAFRAAVQAGVHVVVSKEHVPLYRSITGRDALFVQRPDADQSDETSLAGLRAMDDGEDLLIEPQYRHFNTPEIILPLFTVQRPTRSILESVWIGEGASWKPFHTHRKEVLDDIPSLRSSSVEALLSLEQLRCSYAHLNCDFVAAGETFRKLCQRIRQEYFSRKAVDLFRFASRAKPYDGSMHEAGSLDVRRGYNAPISSKVFLESNRQRVEMAYRYLISQSASAATPINDISRILYTVPDNCLAAAESGELDLAKVLARMDGSSPRGSRVFYFLDGSGSVMRILSWLTFFAGITFILVGVRTAVDSAFARLSFLDWRWIGLSFKTPNKPVRMDERPAQHLESHRISSVLKYILVRAHRMSKSS